LVEFLIAAMLVLIPLALARNALNFATMEAARMGSVTGVDRAAMRLALGRALVPLFVPVDVPALLAGSPAAAEGDLQGATRGLARAMAEALRPDLTRLVIENPSPASFDDFGRIEGGQRVIPNDGLEFENPHGARSGQTLRDANVLAVRVRYCRQLFMPLLDRAIPALLRWSFADPVDQWCLAQHRLPIEAHAVVQMQSAARAENF
jgi:hypothetical protein